MSKNNLLVRIPDEFKYIIAKCLSNAVGDDIREDIRHNRLDEHNNGDSHRIWDFINRNLAENFYDAHNTVVAKTKRGSWVMTPVFEETTRTLITLMREARFKQLKAANANGESKFHYVTALTECLNEELITLEGELTLFDFDDNEDDKSQKQQIVGKILNDLQVPLQEVNQYAVVLFETKNYELFSLRCCILDSNLDIIAQEDWSNYIAVRESVVVEQINTEDEIQNRPNRGIGLKEKAIAKKGQKRNYARKQQQGKEEKNI